MKYELVKRNYKNISLYVSFILLIFTILAILVSKSTEEHGRSESEETVLVFLFAVLLLILFGVLPFLRRPKHTTIGYISFYNDKIIIEDKSGFNQLNIRNIDCVEISLCGYNGQPRIGDTNSYYTAIRPFDGLNNTVKIILKHCHMKYEFYIDSIEAYKYLLNMINTWMKLTDIKSRIR